MAYKYKAFLTETDGITPGRVFDRGEFAEIEEAKKWAKATPGRYRAYIEDRHNEIGNVYLCINNELKFERSYNIF